MSINVSLVEGVVNRIVIQNILEFQVSSLKNSWSSNTILEMKGGVGVYSRKILRNYTVLLMEGEMGVHPQGNLRK